MRKNLVVLDCSEKRHRNLLYGKLHNFLCLNLFCLNNEKNHKIVVTNVVIQVEH